MPSSETVHLADIDHPKAALFRFSTAAELDEEIYRPLSKAHDALEQIIWRLERVAGLTVRPMPGRLEEPPTFHDLGVLHSFIADVDVSLGGLQCRLDQLRPLMPAIDELRRENQISLGESAAA